MIKDKNKRNLANKINWMLFWVMLLSFLTSITFHLFDRQTLEAVFLDEEAKVGPLVIEEPMSVVEVNVNKPFSKYGVWSAISGDVFDENNQFLFSFQKELWQEEGTDSEGHWSETVSNINFKVTFREPGNYWVYLEQEGSPEAVKDMTVTLMHKAGSALPHMILGCILLGILFVTWSITNTSWRDWIDD